VLTNLESESHLLDVTTFGIFAVTLLLLHLLVLEFTPVHDFSNRRRCHRRDFDQIQSGFFSF
jgi:hypothetical protein